MIDIKEKDKSIISSLFWQVLPVMLGVFLGLWANNWNEDRKQEKLQKQVLLKVKEDIESNKVQLENVLEYHEWLGDTATAILNAGDFNILRKSLFEMGRGNPYHIWRGTRTGALRDAGYQTAVVTGILAGLNIELVSLLSEINRSQLNYASMSNNYLQTVINIQTDSKILDQILFASAFSNDISIAEKNLIHLYDLALGHFK